MLKYCEFCLTFSRQIEDAVKIQNDRNFKLTQILKCHKFQSPANVPFSSYFFLLLSYFYPIFIFEVLFVKFLKSYFFPTFSLDLQQPLSTAPISASTFTMSTGTPSLPGVASFYIPFSPVINLCCSINYISIPLPHNSVVPHHWNLLHESDKFLN